MDSQQALLYADWRDFFSKRLLAGNRFSLLNTVTKGDTNIEVYKSLVADVDTTIEVGYLSAMTLIYVSILNPKTPGKNRQQQLEHLYKHEFDSEKQHGGPGLDFNEVNVKGISNLLDVGFNGSETVYYRKGEAVKSKLTTSYYPDSPVSSFTYHFKNELLVVRLFKSLMGVRQKYDEIKVVDLKAIFPGLNAREVKRAGK